MDALILLIFLVERTLLYAQQKIYIFKLLLFENLYNQFGSITTSPNA
jgi:hypothetical protein